MAHNATMQTTALNQIWSGSVAEIRTTDNPYVEQFRTGSLRGPMQPSH